MENREKTCRLFFALWPSNQVRQSIVELFNSLPRQKSGRIMRPHNLHETLHFVGQVTESTRDCMHAAAQSVKAEGFQYNLDLIGLFPRAKILWMGTRNPPEQLLQLHKKLGIVIEGCGFNREKRAYTPHITLLRKYTGPLPEQTDFSIPWQVEEFVLVESVTSEQGVNYRVIEKYPLA